MSCLHPKMAIITSRDPDGKVHLSFKAEHIGNKTYQQAQHIYGTENVVLLPCGHCESCKMAKRREWAVRCACESKFHLNNCFVTLTYDDAHLPKRPSKRDFQDFIKKLRNDGHELRYFGCGELGTNGRFHIHIVLFGFIPSDLVYYGKSKSGMAMFESDYLSRVWNKGFVMVNHFDPACAGYVAGYTAKKIGSDNAFFLMSKRPGIGYLYATKEARKLYDYDMIVDDLGSIKISNNPRYFDKLAKKLGIDLTDVKANRIQKSHDALMYEIRKHGVKSFEGSYLLDSNRSKEKFSKLRRDL